MGACLNDEQLEMLASQEVVEIDSGELKTHLDRCLKCQEALEEWKQNLNFADTVKLVLGTESNPVPEIRSGTGHADATGSTGTTTRDVISLVSSVPGYQILHSIHRGAQGVVYYAVQEETGRQVAIKFLREGVHASESTRKRFEREIELVQSLRHPNIIEVLESGVSTTGHLYYVMDHVRGLPLHRYVWARQLSLEETLELFVTVCGAINYAHQRGVIHRDLKPSNILVDNGGVPHVLDFGLAKQTLEPTESLLSMAGQVVGTLPYMSPEQARGDQNAIDIRTDVYAIGVILYLVLTGRYPCPTVGSMAEVLNHISETPPLPPTRAWTKQAGVNRRSTADKAGDTCPIDDEVETIILRALAKDPERRYQNLATFREDLARYLQGLPIEARRDAGLLVLRRSLARYRAAVAVTAVSVILTSLFSLGMIGLYRNAAYERDRADLLFAREVKLNEQLAKTLVQLGDQVMSNDQAVEALGNYMGALALNQRIAGARTEDLEAQQTLADNYCRVGHCHRVQGNYEAAQKNYERSLFIYNRLAQVASGDARYQRGQAENNEFLAAVAHSQDASETARGHAERAMEVRWNLLQRPEPAPIDQAAYARLLLTVPFSDMKRPEEALERAVAAVARAPDNPVVLATLALAYACNDKPVQANEIKTHVESLVGQMPADRKYRAKLLLSLMPSKIAMTTGTDGKRPKGVGG
jgi:serine/threonine protein kinase